MEVLLGKSAGYCSGAAYGVNKAEEELNAKQTKIYCLGSLSHNPQMMARLTKKGLVTINNLDEIKDHQEVMFRTHGVTKEDYEKAAAKGLKVIDLTCVKVIAVHELAAKYAKEEYYIILIGEKNHPEVLGTQSFCGEYSSVVNEVADILPAMASFHASKKSKILIISQTTFSLEIFNEYTKIIETEAKGKPVIIQNTICDATRIRQAETEELSKRAQGMIIIGGRGSSNTQKLVDIARKYCPYAVQVETHNELDLTKLKSLNRVGVMAGASTPRDLIDDVIKALENCS